MFPIHFCSKILSNFISKKRTTFIHKHQYAGKESWSKFQTFSPKELVSKIRCEKISSLPRMYSLYQSGGLWISHPTGYCFQTTKGERIKIRRRVARLYQTLSSVFLLFYNLSGYVQRRCGKRMLKDKVSNFVYVPQYLSFSSFYFSFEPYRWKIKAGTRCIRDVFALQISTIP